MATDGNASDSLSARFLSAVVRRVVRFPRTTLLVAVALAVAALMLAGSRLSFKTSRLDLLNPKSAYNQRWIDYIEEFGDKDDVVVVVEGADVEQIAPVLQAVGRTLVAEKRFFLDVLYEIDSSAIHGKALHYWSGEQLADTARFLESVDPVLAGDWSSQALYPKLQAHRHLLSGRPGQIPPQQRAAADRRMAALAESLAAWLAVDAPVDAPPWTSPWNGSAPPRKFDADRLEYLTANDGRLGFVLLRLAEDEGRFDAGSAAIDRLRELLTRVQKNHPDVRLGLTGLPVMENDEMRESQRSSMRAGAISLAGVACLLIAGLGGIRHPLVTVATLLLAIAWTMGYLTIAVGHLNILSVAFGVILVGLGIDFGIHVIARYLLLRHRGEQSAAALEQTASSVGPGVLTGGATTALAFFTAGLTDFTGVAELGIIAGGGVLLCLVGALVVLPAMVYLIDRRGGDLPLPAALRIDRFLTPTVRYPALVLGLSASVVVGVALGLPHLRYDHNLLNMQAEGLQSVVWEQKLMDESDESIWFALSICDSPQQLRQRKRAFEKLPAVEHTEEIVSRLPPSAPNRRAKIEPIARRLATLPTEVDQLPLAPHGDFGEVVRWLEQNSDPAQARDWAAIGESLEALPRPTARQRLSEFQQRAAVDLLDRLRALRAMANPEPPQFSDLPPALVTRYVGRHGRHLLKVYSRGNAWEMDDMQRFVQQVRSVDPAATGKPLQTYEASRQMQSSYIHAAVYSLLAVLMVLVIDFRHVGHVALALLPLGAGIVLLFGLMGIVNLPLNPANMIVLPLIMGIGIDDGVHLVHDFLRQRRQQMAGPFRPYRIGASTASAVLITSLTTMIGFGSLMISDHRGMQSLGRVLTVGVACCLFTSLVMLPALLALIARRDETASQAEDQTVEVV
ncbi:MAG: MMPL family transporter [Planctomycetes bacterium]|nr:MMPL family transporter [Planctomycetota bacterium]